LRIHGIHRQGGFVLIELVTTLVLVGVIGVFAGLFLYSGINGYLASKRNSENALKVQIAMDRISLELRDIKASPKPSFGTNTVTYQSSNSNLPGTRILRLVSGASGPGIYLSVDGASNILLDNLDLANSGITYDASRNLDSSLDGTNEIAFIKVAFRFLDMGKPFVVSVYPRNMITFP
jgi:hypothetical protein